MWVLAPHGVSWHNYRAVRTLPLYLVLLAVPAFAQEQERKLAERVTRPNMDMTYDVRQSSYGGNKSFSAGNARVKDFQYRQKYSPREFQAKSFYSGKNAWSGDFQFSTKEASTRGKYEVPNANTQAATKTMPTKAAHDSAKTMQVGEYAKAQRPYLGREHDRMKTPHDPNSPPVGWTGDLKPMTIDDIRTLLNKNK